MRKLIILLACIGMLYASLKLLAIPTGGGLQPSELSYVLIGLACALVGVMAWFQKEKG